jgi:hypothetical protein
MMPDNDNAMPDNDNAMPDNGMRRLLTLCFCLSLFSSASNAAILASLSFTSIVS